MLILKIVGFLFLTVEAILGACPSDWVQNGPTCYYYSGNDGIFLPWHEAHSKCEAMSGGLVVINDEVENNYVFNLLGTDNSYAWIGLHDLNQEGDWQWVDGSDLSYKAWAGGQPDNWQDAQGAQEDCVEMIRQDGGVWNDKACSLPQYFICERLESAEVNKNCDETNGWEEYENRCYVIIDSKVPWVSANTACKDLQANLVNIGGQTEQFYVSNEVNEWNQHIWIGLSSVGHPTNQLYWSNGDVFTASSYNNWPPTGQPALDPNSDNCVEIDPSVSYDGPWGIDRCGEGHAFMCERGYTGTCAEGWRMYDGYCYLYATAESAWESWITADALCTAMGAKLLKIDNDGLEKYIIAHLPDFQDAGSLGLWLGFSDTDNDGVFMWTDGQSATNSNYKIFGPNQPRDQPGAFDCGQIFTGSTSGVWETDDCFKKQAYICQIPTGVDVSPIDPPANVNMGCDPGWLGFDNHCYFFEPSREVTWQQAEEDCVTYGGHLASAPTAEENAFITGHVTRNVWLGGNDLSTDNKWTWSDQSPWSFQDWYSGEPNCGTCCLQIWKDANLKWDDTPCNSVKPYVCKKQQTDCWEELGMEDGRILDQEITASSIWGPGWEATEARLNNVNDATHTGAWSPKIAYAECQAIDPQARLDCGTGSQQECLDRGCCYDNSISGVKWCFHYGTVPPAGTEWIQVKLVPSRTVSGITTQGRPADVNEFVTSYQVAYSQDGVNFQFAKDRTGSTQTFSGNSDTSTPVSNKFYSPVKASYIRLYPYGYNLYPALRMEILGCTASGDELVTPSPDEACTSVDPNERLDCGYPGITQAECVSKGCCHDNTITGVKWCFYGKDQFDPRCGKDWSFDPHGEVYCYHFNDYSLRTWQHARDYCLGMGGDLLSVNSKAEQSYVTGQLTTLVMTHALWIGANRNDGNSGWKWSNGQPFNYLYWEDGEPNGGSNNEFCVEAYTSNSKWNDINCANERGMICKKFANIVSPLPIDQNEYVINICEGETYTLGCPGLQIIIHHASYGRANIATCSSDQGVPAGGCHSEDSLDIVSQMCNNMETCTLTASNEVFGDPCNGVYKYLNVIYSCEQKVCFSGLGVENGTVADSQISQSTYLDNQHKGIDARLNGPRSWATQEGVGAYLQVTFRSNVRVTGVIIQGANDASRYVTSFTVAFANDATYQEWTTYSSFDNVVMNFTGNTDQQTPVRAVLAEHVFTAGIRIQPQSWQGDMIGMRVEITGCNPLRELACNEIGDILWATDETANVDIIKAECPGLCPLSGIPVVYGTDIYAGSSQICNAAVHAGVIIDRFGGPVTIVKKQAQSTYVGSVKNGITSFDESYYPVAFSFAGNEETCEIGWKPYSSFCFYFGSENLPWAEAEAKCVAMGGHLASVRDGVEQDFLGQQIILQDSDNWWIGLNDLRSFNEFEWIDSEPVLYTNWGPSSPDNYDGKMENCVRMGQETQKWDDYLCDEVSAYVCKKYKGYYTPDQSVEPTPPAGCPEGWSAYEGTCYLFQRDLVSEGDSEAFCEGQGGMNVHVQSKYVQSFLHTMIGSEDWRWWIGLHAHVTTETGVSWAWESGDPVTYDNWGLGNPDIDLGECTVFYGGQFGNGMWYSHRCEKQAYSICERPREGWTVPPTTTPAPTGGCAWDWSTPQESSGFCYKVFVPAEGTEWDKKQGWENARHQCMNEGGDLVSIHNKDEEIYLMGELSKLGVNSESVWIGLNNRDQISWSWSDGTPVEYLSWNTGAPSNTLDNTCVAMKYEPAFGTAFWDNLNCHETLDWLCRRPKGIEVVNPTQPPTGKPNAACGSSEDGTWIEYEGMCYLFNDALPVDVHTAQRVCQTTGGELLSVHTIAESAFVTNQIKGMTGVSRFWIGLRETGGVSGAYAWSDGTPVDFVNWSAGEPNDAVGIEQCVTTLQDSGRWNDDNCGLKLSGYVCKKYLGAPPNPPQPTQPWPGGCPSGWLMYSNYCYQVHGEANICDPTATDNVECAATWRGAVEYCKTKGGALTSIHDKYENAFITAQTIRAYHNLWIGMSDTQWGLYSWANGDEVTYTNWNTGEPNHHNGEENCGEMYHSETLAGRWNDKNCEGVTPFVCSMGKDPSIAPGSELNNNKKCPSGWTQFDTLDGHYVCYYLDSTPRTFADAQQNCRNMKSELASLQTMFDQHFITSYLRGQSAWLGMKLNPDTQDWVWVDGWPVWISNWGENQPTSDLTKACVVNVDSVFGSEWLTADCTQTYQSICKTSTEEIPPTPGYIEGTCPDNTWHEYGGFCVKTFLTLNGANEALSWGDAEADCTTYAGHLASFTSRHELEWLLSWYNETETLWIGLRSNGQGGWSWVDNRPVSFTYWNEGEPNNAHEDNEDCVEMYGGSGKWNDIACTDTHGYVCLAPKVVGTDSDGNVIHYTTPEPPEEKHDNHGAVIAGVVIGVIFIILLFTGLAIYLYRNNATASKIAETASEIPTGIVNKLYSLAGNMPEESSGKEAPPVHYEKDGGATVDDSNA